MDKSAIEAVTAALTSLPGSKPRWEMRVKETMTDAELRRVIMEEMGMGGSVCTLWIRARWVPVPDPMVKMTYWHGMPDLAPAVILQGKDLLKVVRGIYRIKRPTGQLSLI